jgi:hypothetical protein
MSRLRKPAAVLAGIMLAAFAQRLYVLAIKLPTINSDEAIIGLMGRHIQAGERPFFYYGQSYYGPLDAYLDALIFSLWGSNDLTLRLLPLLCSLLFVPAVYWLGRRIYSERVGMVSAMFAALCPAFLAVRGLKGDAAYSLVLLIGTLSLLLFQDWLARPSRWKLAGLAALSLLGTWVFPLMLFYVFAMLATGVWVAVKARNSRGSTGRRLTRFGKRTILLLGGSALALGAACLAAAWSGGMDWLSRLIDVSKVFLFALPIFWGLIPPTEDYALFIQAISQIPAWQMALITLASLAMFATVLVFGGRQFASKPPLLFIFITGSGFVYVLFFVMVGISPETLSYPRYLFPLYSSIPFWVNGLLGLAQKKGLAQAGLIAAVLALNVYSVVSLPVTPGPTRDLLVWFGENPEADGVYTDYWTGYWLAFESQERVIPVIISNDNQLSFGNRYQPYVEQARAWRDPVFIYIHGAAAEENLRSFLFTYAVQYEREQIGAYTLYHGLSKVVASRPGGLELVAPPP